MEGGRASVRDLVKMPFGDHSSLIYKSRSDALSGQRARPTPSVTFSNSADWSE